MGLTSRQRFQGCIRASCISHFSGFGVSRQLDAERTSASSREPWSQTSSNAVSWGSGSSA